MNLDYISRGQWKDTLKMIKKAGIDGLKNYVGSIYESAFKEGLQIGYDKGLTAGVVATKTNIMEVVESAIHKEFGIGPVRMAKFHNRFLEEVNLRADANKDKKEQAECTQEELMGEQDKQRYMVLLSVKTFIENIEQAEDNVAFSNNAQLHMVHDQLSFLLHGIESKMNPVDRKTIEESLVDKALYIAPIKLGENND